MVAIMQWTDAISRVQMEEQVFLTRVATMCFYRSQSRDEGVSNYSVDLRTKGSR